MMSTIHPPNEPCPESALIYPMWWVVLYEKASHTNGDSYYVRAPNRATGVIRAVSLHPDNRPFEKLEIEEATAWMDKECGYGLET